MFYKDTYLFKRFIDRKLKKYLIKKVSSSTRNKNKVIIVITNIKCNLKCYCCSTFCDLETGANAYNKNNFILKPDILDEFLNNISDFRPDYFISLQGGETTILDKNIIENYVKVIKDNNRKVLLLTNGYGIRKLNPFLFDSIVLDEHMQNENDIRLAVKYFNSLNYNDYSVNITKYHYDLRSIMKDNRIENNFICNDMFDAIIFHNKIVYPCCVLPMLMGYENRIDYVLDLEKAGFVYNNENLSYLLNNIENCLPETFYDVCNNYCYRRRIKARKIYKPTDYKEK